MWTTTTATRLLAVIACASVLVTACGEDPAPAYGDENREAFLAACRDPDVDDLIQSRLCLCFYDEAEATMDIERFLAIEDELTGDPEAILPDDVVELLARCIIDEADL